MIRNSIFTAALFSLALGFSNSAAQAANYDSQVAGILDASAESGCDDHEGPATKMGEKACSTYTEMDQAFGQNEWTQHEGEYCKKFYSMAFRLRNVICAYKKEDDAVAGNITAAAGGTTGQTSAEGNTAREFGAAKAMHDKYHGLVSKYRNLMMFAFQDYANALKANGSMRPQANLRQEAMCSGASGGGAGLKIQQTHFLIVTVIKHQVERLQKVGPALREAANYAEKYAEAMSKGTGDVASTAADRQRGLESLPTIPGSSDDLASHDHPSHTHGADTVPAAVVPAKEQGMKMLEKRVHKMIPHGSMAANGLGVGGALVSIGVDVLLDRAFTGHWAKPDPRSVAATVVGIGSFGLGLAASVLVNRIQSEEAYQAYYRSWASHDAPTELNPVKTPTAKARDVSNAFCKHIEDEKKKAVEETRQQMQGRADQMRASMEQRQAMYRDMEVVRNAPSDQRAAALEAYRRKWGIPNP